MRKEAAAFLMIGILSGCAAMPEAIEIRVLPSTYVVGGRTFVSASEAAEIAMRSRPKTVQVRGCMDAPYKMIGDIVEALKRAQLETIALSAGDSPEYCATP